MESGLAQRGLFKVRRSQLEAQGVPEAEIATRLVSGPSAAFPFTAQRELLSEGTVKTLTILVDFSDHESGGLPTPADFHANIYGTGTSIGKAFEPYESVHEYYRRASNGKVDLQGNVLGWHRLSKERDDYSPQYQPGMTNRQKMEIDNRANFRLFTEALSALDEEHDFSQYDNDNDGDIDLVTVLYAGPPEGWGSFWWAYRWQFYPSLTPDAATTTFDGKRLNQFVFQFIDVRTGTQDFNPLTLIHEMGHGFGLPDYYDYDGTVGLSGGVGDLDIMDANWGNHNAFSRWLLDWIDPAVIGGTGSQTLQLEAAGKGDDDPSSPEAIAIFPGLNEDASAPSSELYMIENRHPIGNDGGVAQTPGEGCLIWHVDATPDAFGRDFRFNNSYTAPKLIRLVRADNPSDFSATGRATGATYFGLNDTLSPSSSPSSASNAGNWTGVRLVVRSEPGETVEVEAGIDTEGPIPSDAGSGIALFGGLPPAAASQITQPVSVDSDSEKPSGQQATARPSKTSQLDELLALSSQLDRSTPGELVELLSVKLKQGAKDDQSIAELKVIVSKLAGKDGKSAVETIEQEESGEVRSQVFATAMEAWMQSRPESASKWYLQEHMVKAGEEASKSSLAGGGRFSALLSAYVAGTEPKSIPQVISSTHNLEELSGVTIGLRAQHVSLDDYITPINAKFRSFEAVPEPQLFFDRDTLQKLRLEEAEGDEEFAH